jgi:hypothetical protein
VFKPFSWGLSGPSQGAGEVYLSGNDLQIQDFDLAWELSPTSDHAC